MEPILKDNVIAAVDKVETKKRNRKGPYTTENGIVLKYRKVSSQLIYSAWANLPIPQVPMVWIEERGRDEPNPGDPTYNEELGKYMHDRTRVSTTIFFMHGLDVFSIPEDMISIESDDWFIDIEEWIKVPQSKLGRKAAWLMFYAIPDDNEQGEIIADLMILNGMILEKTVDQALSSFRGDQGSEVDPETQSQA